MIDVMGVAMGIDIQASTRPSDDLPTPSSSPTPPSPPTASSSKPKPTPAPAEEDVEMNEAEAEESKLKKDAEDAKKMGSEAYKKRNFDEAATLFQKAWDTWPKDVSYLTNLSGKIDFKTLVDFEYRSAFSCLL
jgi:stress-induced-phosphoprotein 1